MIERNYILKPEYDGITHLNIYSKAKTMLGRMLSNFYYFPFKTIHGNFYSVEGLWHWLGIEECDEKEILKFLYGYKARKIGLELKKKYKKNFDEKFKEKIIKAIQYKIYKNLDMFTDDIKNLPFEHYYIFNGMIIDEREKNNWMITAIDKIRNDIINVEKRIIKKV